MRAARTPASRAQRTAHAAAARRLISAAEGAASLRQASRAASKLVDAVLRSGPAQRRKDRVPSVGIIQGRQVQDDGGRAPRLLILVVVDVGKPVAMIANGLRPAGSASPLPHDSVDQSAEQSVLHSCQQHRRRPAAGHDWLPTMARSSSSGSARAKAVLIARGTQPQIGGAPRIPLDAKSGTRKM